MRPQAFLHPRSTRLVLPMAALLTVIGSTAAAAAPVAGGLARPSAHPAAAKPAPFIWHTFHLINGWESASTKALPTGAPAWAFRSGVIYLRGAIMKPDNHTNPNPTFAKLPTYARPQHNLYIKIYTASSLPGLLYIGRLGSLVAENENVDRFASLSAVSYPAHTIQLHPLTLMDGWMSSQPGAGAGSPSYAVRNGVVYLAGAANGGTSQTVAVLPRAARPAHQLFISLSNSTAQMDFLQILPTGEINSVGPDVMSFTSLAGISFPVASTKWHNFTLANGWKSGRADFNSSDPAYAVIDSVVYLEGSMFDTTTSSGRFAPVPAAARPADVLEIEVYTTDGTSGSVAMGMPFGHVASTPFSNAKAFTSLAGIAYPLSS